MVVKIGFPLIFFFVGKLFVQLGQNSPTKPQIRILQRNCFSGKSAAIDLSPLQNTAFTFTTFKIHKKICNKLLVN